VTKLRRYGNKSKCRALTAGVSRVPHDAPPKIVILLVEDHPLVRACMAEALLEAGFDALDTGNATEAIAMLDIRPDIKLVLPTPIFRARWTG